MTAYLDTMNKILLKIYSWPNLNFQQLLTSVVVGSVNSVIALIPTVVRGFTDFISFSVRIRVQIITIATYILLNMILKYAYVKLFVQFF